MKKVFRGDKEWEAMHAAEQWCRENGISVGTTQDGSPRGLVRGYVSIAKWRNLSVDEVRALDGRMTGDMRHGPVTIELFWSRLGDPWNE